MWNQRLYDLSARHPPPLSPSAFQPSSNFQQIYKWKKKLKGRKSHKFSKSHCPESGRTEWMPPARKSCSGKSSAEIVLHKHAPTSCHAAHDTSQPASACHVPAQGMSAHQWLCAQPEIRKCERWVEMCVKGGSPRICGHLQNQRERAYVKRKPNHTLEICGLSSTEWFG